MNDLPRPSPYQAWHDIVVVDGFSPEDPAQRLDVVGPICESGDFLAKDRALRLSEDSLLAVLRLAPTACRWHRITTHEGGSGSPRRRQRTIAYGAEKQFRINCGWNCLRISD